MWFLCGGIYIEKETRRGKPAGSEGIESNNLIFEKGSGKIILADVPRRRSKKVLREKRKDLDGKKRRSHITSLGKPPI